MQTVELEDGWLAIEVAPDMWKLERPRRNVGIGTFPSLEEAKKYLETEVTYGCREEV